MQDYEIRGNTKIIGNNLECFKSYLNNQKQFISFNNKSTSFVDIKCGIQQESILGPLLCLIYVNYLNRASDILDVIMYANNTNLFYSHNDIKTLFH